MRTTGLCLRFGGFSVSLFVYSFTLHPAGPRVRSRYGDGSKHHAPEMARTGGDPAMMAEAHFPGWNIRPKTDTV